MISAAIMQIPEIQEKSVARGVVSEKLAA